MWDTITYVPWHQGQNPPVNQMDILPFGGAYETWRCTNEQTEPKKRNTKKLVHKFHFWVFFTRKRNRSREFTCSIRLRTANAGLGKPCADVALWTPPEIGVLKSPALDPPVPLPDPAGVDAVFGASSKLLLGLWVGLVLAFRMWKKPSQQSWSSHFIHSFTDLIRKANVLLLIRHEKYTFKNVLED